MKLKDRIKDVDFKNIKVKEIDLKNINIKSFRKMNYKAVCIALTAAFIVGIPLAMFDAKKGRDKKASIEKLIDEDKVQAIIDNNKRLGPGEFILPQWSIQRAKNEFANGDADRGRELLEIASKSEAIDSEQAREIVLAYFLNGDTYKSIELGEKYIEKFNNDIVLHKTMIMVYLYNGAKGRAENIINELSDSVSISVGQLDSGADFKNLSHEEISLKYAELAEMNYLVDDRQASLEYLEKAWGYNSDNYKIYDLLSKMATDNLADTLKSISYREEIVKERSDKDNYTIYDENMYKLWIAKIYTMSDSTAVEAEYLIDEYGKGRENSVNIRRMKSSAYLLNGKVEEAMKIIDQLKLEYPEDFSVHYTASILYYLTEAYDKALEEALLSSSLNPEYEDTYSVLLPNIYKALGEEGEIESYFALSIAKNPISVSNLNLIANYYYRNGDFDKAIQYYNIAMVLNPNNAEVKYKAALAMVGNAEKLSLESAEKEEEIKGYYERALELAQNSIELTKDNPVAKYYRMASIVEMQLGEVKEAYNYIRKAYSLDEDDIYTLNNAGIFHIIMNNSMNEKENDDRVQRGWYNLYKAYEGLNGDYEQEVIDVVSKNYEIAKDFREKFRKADDDAVMELPKGFKLLY